MRYHCLQHVAFETPGLIANWIGEQGDVLSFTGLYQNDPLPAIHEFDALVIMGGPMSVHDEAEFPWLKKEKELIAAAIREKKKVLGICLGAQLIAEAAGARVYLNSQKEIGFWPLCWTEAAREWLGLSSRDSERETGADGQTGTDERAGVEGEQPGIVWRQTGGERMFGCEGQPGAAGEWPAECLVFHWHGETFDLPEGSIHLAFTAVCPNQGFLLGETALGLQFHPEVTPAIVREMMVYEGHELASAGAVGEPLTVTAGEPGSTPSASYVQSETAILGQLSSLKGNEKLLYPLLDRFFHGLRPE